MMTYPLLSHISSPSDLRSLTPEQRKELAQEIRQVIIDILSENGGHLASNLGIVELTIALHTVFDSPTDKLIFDVSHQTYPHKLLTGRLDRFSLLRQFKGLCGFAHPKESPHDHFFAGHAGTALSLALGVAADRDLQNRSDYVIPITGDASFTCGLTLEALNNIPRNLKRFILILNDNKMSISSNVGAISHILSRLISSPKANKLYSDIEALLTKIPNYGSTLAKQGHKIKESLKNLVSSAPFFEQFGLSYVGPIDGHDIKKMVEVLTELKEFAGPVILHVMTEKGHGMETALQNPTRYHGVKPFDKATGKFHPSSSTKSSFPKIFGAHLLQLANDDPDFVAITPAMAAGSCLENFAQSYPNRCIDVGIAEGHAITLAGGLSKSKETKVIVSIYATFLQRALDQLFHDVCLQECPVIFAIDRAGISGPDGSTHHGIYDISFLQTMPNMVICQPRNGQLLKELLSSSFSWNRPTAIRYPNLETEVSNAPLCTRALGTAEVLKEGKEIAIVALGHMCETALEVREILKEHGITATVIDPVFLKPLDSDLFYRILSSHTHLITLEEHAVTGGLGSLLNNFVIRNQFHAVSVMNFGIPDAFVEYGSHQELMHELGLDAPSIAKAILTHFALANNKTSCLS